MTEKNDKPKNTHGGSRGGGRPKLDPDAPFPATRHTITLPLGMAPEIAAKGGGNLSEGVRKIWRYYDIQATIVDQRMVCLDCHHIAPSEEFTFLGQEIKCPNCRHVNLLSKFALTLE